MTARTRVQRARGWILTANVLRAVVLATLAAVFCLVSVTALGLHGSVGYGAAIGSAIAVILLRVRKVLRAASVGRTALWLEERIPSLQYALATAIDADSDSPAAPRLERLVDDAPLERVVRRAVGTSLLRSTALLVIGTLLAMLTSGLVKEVVASNPGGGAAGDPRSPLEVLSVRIEPPSYSGLAAAETEAEAGIEALPGSRIFVDGKKHGEFPAATLAGSTLASASTRNGWRLSFIMPSAAAVLRLRAGNSERIVAILPMLDAPPQLVLDQPIRDTILPSPTGILNLASRVTDDFGVRRAYFEVLLTSGAGEVYSTQNTIVGETRAASNALTIRAAVRLESLSLKPGAVLSVRAVGYDGNDVSGPGRGSSETRTIRIAYAEGQEPPAVAGAPPAPADSAMMSQRMIIIRTEQLDRARTTLPRDSVVTRAIALAAMQDRLRRRVDEIITMYLAESDGGKPTRIVGFLRVAYDAMWEAVRELNIAETATALPPMRRALAALDSARRAERLYLRSQPPRISIDVDGVRLKGDEKGMDSERRPRAPAELLREETPRKLSAIIELARTDRTAAANSMNALRVELRSAWPAAADAMGRAAEAMRTGKSPDAHVLDARRALFAQPQSASGIGSWTGVWQ